MHQFCIALTESRARELDPIVLRRLPGNKSVDENDGEENRNEETPAKLPVPAHGSLQHELNVTTDSTEAVDPRDCNHFQDYHHVNYEGGTEAVNESQHELTTLE
jgi:hypothetical protein